MTALGAIRTRRAEAPTEAASGAGSWRARPWSTPIVSRHIADEVVDRLVTAVALGLYVPGQQLPPERELATMLGVSRASVREALQQLTETGYLEVRRGRFGGTFVRASWGQDAAGHVRRQILAHWAEFERIFDARTLIEPVIARTASDRRTAGDMETIGAALQAYLDAPDRDASWRADARLHLAIAEATQNPILVGISIDLRTKITLNLGAEPYSDEVRRIAVLQHQHLVAAIVEQRADDAARLAAQHFLLSETLIRELAQRVRDEDAHVGAAQ